MTENRRQILDMLAQGKINVDEAERLISLVDRPSSGEPGAAEQSGTRRPAPKYLRVVAGDGSSEEAERVNIRVPMALIRAGVKLASLIPSNVTTKVNEELQRKGVRMDLGNLKGEDVEQFIDAIAKLEVDVQDGKQKVRIFVE